MLHVCTYVQNLNLLQGNLWPVRESTVSHTHTKTTICNSIGRVIWQSQITQNVLIFISDLISKERYIYKGPVLIIKGAIYSTLGTVFVKVLHFVHKFGLTDYMHRALC